MRECDICGIQSKGISGVQDYFKSDQIRDACGKCYQKLRGIQSDICILKTKKGDKAYSIYQNKLKKIEKEYLELLIQTAKEMRREM